MTLSGAPVIPPQSRYARQLPQGGAFGCAGNFTATTKAVPLGKVAANAVSRRKGCQPCAPVKNIKSSNSKASLKREREYHPL